MLFLFHLILLSGAVHASGWFSSEPDYVKWSHAELRTWLEQHNIKVPPSFDKPHLYDLVDANWQSPPSSLAAYAESSRQWSIDQYTRAQRAFQYINHDSFDQWDESKLRAFLLEHGVVAPSGPREQLVVLAKNKYRAFTDAAALYSSLASGSISAAYVSATDAADSASQCIGHSVAQATHEVARAFDDTKDYVYASWDDNRLRDWLEDHGIIEAKSAHTKEELLRLANAFYSKSTSPVWESWSDSYIREWLIAHNLLKNSDSLTRPSLLEKMKRYYYKLTDNVWNTWSDSELKSWLVNHLVLKSDAQKNRDELITMVEEHYPSALDTIWAAWTDSDMRQWLSVSGYLEDINGANNRKDLVNLMNSRYPDAATKVASYLVWPDARLRAYLRERGISEDALPTNRPGLLQETRIHWVQASTRTEAILTKLKEIINNSVEAVEEKVAHVLEALSGHSRDIANYASEKVDGFSECADMQNTHTWSGGFRKRVDDATDRVAEVKQFGQRERADAVKHVNQHADGVRRKVQAADEL